jgi:Tol biopolymer transport system component
VDGDTVLDPGDPVHGCSQIVVSDAQWPHPREITPPGYMHYDPAVSPDGQWIAYTSTIAGNDEIFKIRLDGGSNVRLTENVWEWDKHPSWSPDGARLAFYSNRDGRKQIYLMNADGSGLENVSQNAYNDWDPVWVR